MNAEPPDDLTVAMPLSGRASEDNVFAGAVAASGPTPVSASATASASTPSTDAGTGARAPFLSPADSFDSARLPPAGSDNKALAGQHLESTLAPGTRIGEFEILSVVGNGGFGIVYLALDHTLERRVALKEYMPATLACRTPAMFVTLRAGQDAETFQAGLRSFINEARLLARFDHPALLKVYRFWEGNGTAYMAMPFYHGQTLKSLLRQQSQPPDEAWLRTLLAPLLDALEVLHAQRCYHRDIAPDNIQILADGQPLLLDFGAARRAIGDLAQDFTVILKPGYAPIEQYADDPSLRQGPWTDLYALASVIHFTILGKPPAPSVTRLVSDPQVPLAVNAAGRYSAGFLAALDQALAALPRQRPQSVAQLRALLGQQMFPRQPGATVVHHASGEPSVPDDGLGARSQAVLSSGASGASANGSSRSSDGKAGIIRPIRKAVLGTALAVVVIAGAAALLLHRPVTPDATVAGNAASVSKAVEQSKAAPSDATVLPPVPKSAQVAVPARTTGPAQVTVPARTTAPAEVRLPPESTAPIDPVEELERIYQARSSDRLVDVSLDNPRVRIGRDRLRFTIRSNRSGHVYLMMVGSDRSQFHLLFPNAIDRNNLIKAGTPLTLPRPTWRMDAAGPPGIDHFVVLVSETPRDFSAAGLRKSDPFAEFPLTGARPGMSAAGDSSSGSDRQGGNGAGDGDGAGDTGGSPGNEHDGLPLYAGRAICPGKIDTPCSPVYGAASFAIEEVRQR